MFRAEKVSPTRLLAKRRNTFCTSVTTQPAAIECHTYKQQVFLCVTGAWHVMTYSNFVPWYTHTHRAKQTTSTDKERFLPTELFHSVCSLKCHFDLHAYVLSTCQLPKAYTILGTYMSHSAQRLGGEYGNGIQVRTCTYVRKGWWLGKLRALLLF